MPEDNPDDERATGWDVEPHESGFVAFWPHNEPLSKEEFITAVGSWVGSDVATDAIEADDDSLWAVAIQVPGIESGLLAWCEKSRKLTQRDMDQIGPDASKCPWVIRVQTILSSDEPAQEYFMVVSLLGGALPDVVSLLDVITGEVYLRARIDRDFLAQDAAPVERVLWRLGRYEGLVEGKTDSVLLGTCGLARCGMPELEVVEVPRELSEAGAVLLHTIAGLLLEGEMPPPGSTIDVGDDLTISLQRVADVESVIPDAAAGSAAWRAKAREHGLAEFAQTRAVVCAEKMVGSFRPSWVWPKEVIERIASGKAVLYMTQQSVRATERLARATWSSFALAFTSLMRSDSEKCQQLAKSGFCVQAPVPGSGHPRIEQSWFLVQKLDHDTLTVRVVDQPITREDLAPGSTLQIPASQISDWRVELEDETFEPDESDALLAAVDLVREKNKPGSGAQ